MPTWMNRTKEAEAARQAEQRWKRQEKGNCIRCGLARSKKSQQLCDRHLEMQRVARNAYNRRKALEVSDD